jgi:hypothetical protein
MGEPDFHQLVPFVFRHALVGIVPHPLLAALIAQPSSRARRYVALGSDCGSSLCTFAV